MAELLLHKKPVDSVFQLLGHKENDITFSVGWALSRSQSFLKAFLRSSISWKEQIHPQSTVVRLQTYELDKGITDIEIEVVGKFFLIVEAKRGWNLPSPRQLQKYLRRRSFSSSKTNRKAIVVLSECSSEYAKEYLRIPKNNGVPIIPLSWRQVYACSKKAKRTSSHAEKRLLTELSNYLDTLMSMQNTESNWVYVVTLASSKHYPKGWRINFRDIVNKKHLYFHSFGRNGWPSEPPNYIAFRYRGQLQSIHHIRSYEIFTNPHKVVKDIPNQKWDSHILYHLGQPIVPSKVVRTGKLFRNGRVWCMLDTLLTSKTISDARDLSKKRIRNQ